MQIRPITTINPVRMQAQNTTQIQQKGDSIVLENIAVDKKPLVDRKIISPNTNVNDFFKQTATRIFPNSPMADNLSSLLIGGYISLSSNAYADLKNPQSATALKLDPSQTSVQHCAKLEKYLANGVGVGINFSNFDDPIGNIRYINNYFKFRQPHLNRPPAGIALLNVTHPKIMDFITMKDDKDYQNWCFNLSVILDDEFLTKVDNREDLILDDGSRINSTVVYDRLLNSMAKSGEPGVIFSSDKNFICDCCAATKLKENENLTLAQVNLSKFYNSKTNSVDYAFLSQSTNTLALALKRIAPNGFISVLGYQDLLNKLGQNYGSKDALLTLEKCLGTVKEQALSQDIKMAISPSGTTSRILKTSYSIEPTNNPHATYWDEIDTLAAAQKHLEGGISKTFNLKENHTIQDVDLIIRNSYKAGIKGVTVFPVQ